MPQMPMQFSQYPADFNLRDAVADSVDVFLGKYLQPERFGEFAEHFAKQSNWDELYVFVLEEANRRYTEMTILEREAEFSVNPRPHKISTPPRSKRYSPPEDPLPLP